jgi:hypothetical protein
MPKTPTLEEQLAALTADYLTKVMATIRNASFAEVAGYSGGRIGVGRVARTAKSTTALREVREVREPRETQVASSRRPRQTADKRAELADRIVDTLRRAGSPMGVRALSRELAVAPDLLTGPLRELRAGGRIKKHGEKRNTTYSAA